MKIALLALPLALAGCASNSWFRPGSTEQEFHADRYECMSGAHAAIPQANAQFGGYRGPATATCTTIGNTTNCTGQPGIRTAPVTVDMNNGARQEAFKACMMGRGWRLATS